MPALFFTIFGCIAAIVAVTTFVAAEVAEIRRRRAARQNISRAVAGAERKKAPKRINIIGQQAPAKSVHWDKIPAIAFLDRQIKVAGLDWDAGMTALAMLGLGLLGALIGNFKPLLVHTATSMIGLALFMGALPWIYIRRTRDKRLTAFESQFPDALDFFARAIRAGHAFSVSLELMANEAPEPTRTEFRRVFTEHQLGAPLESALTGLTERIPLIDTRFFVSAVLVQRETGGNLSEMLENLSSVIRERFQLKGKVRAASAHGRMTAGALTVIPIVLVIMLTTTRPTYLRPMFEDEYGRMALAFAVIGQIAGYFVMKKIVNIKV